MYYLIFIAFREVVFYIDELFNFLISINVIRVSFKQNSHLSMFPFTNEHKNDLGKLNGIQLYSFRNHMILQQLNLGKEI